LSHTQQEETDRLRQSLGLGFNRLKTGIKETTRVNDSLAQLLLKNDPRERKQP
jgi:hypothetical protein